MKTNDDNEVNGDDDEGGVVQADDDNGEEVRHADN